MFSDRRFDLYLAGKFSSLGACVARSPGVFIIVPLLITLLMGSGVQQFNFTSDVFYLFVPAHAKSIHDRLKLQEMFPENLTQHVRGSELRFHACVDLILVPREGSTALSRDVWEEAAILAETISTISVYSDGRTFSWSDLCVRFKGVCVDNTFLGLLNTTQGDLDNLRYPVMVNQEDHSFYPLMAHLGGVEVMEGEVIQAGALRLTFMLDDSSKPLKKASLKWTSAVHHFMEKVRLKTSDVTCFSPSDVEQELVNNIQTAFEENFPFIVSLVSVFTIMNCMSTDWVRSKPMMGVVGLLCVILSAFSGFGLSLYLGFPWQAINVVVIFLLIGIGMDGVFLMLSAWSRSELVSRELITRMSTTYSDASVSLTITSLTNVLSFLVGATVPGFPCVHIFCVYAGISLIFNYLWIITLFGAFLAISGHMEVSNRHCLLLTKVESKTEADQESSSFFYKVFLAGGISWKDPDHPRDNKGEKLMIFFREIVTPFLNFSPTKILILIGFTLYLIAAVFGILGMEEGLEMQNLAMKTSSVVPHFTHLGNFFRDHPYRIQIAITEELDYHDKYVQERVRSLISELEESRCILDNPKYRQSWLHEFLAVAEKNFLIFNITTKQQFNSNLKLFVEEADQLSTDVVFNKNYTGVEASRFFLQSEKMQNPETEMKMMIELREILRKYPFEVIAFNPHFVIFDQFLEVFNNTLLCVALCSIIMTLVILVFLPNKLCVIWVTITVLSVEVGVVGLMSFWGINLDVISMIVIIMGIGFSVDFSAHVSYHYLSTEEDISPLERLGHCLFALGPPILQGAATTILSVAPLLRHDSYVILTFAKMIFLVIVLGLLHSLLLLPVLLSIFAPNRYTDKKSSSIISDILSPSNTTPLSETFQYKNGTDNSLLKQALTGDAKRRKHASLDEVQRSFANFSNGNDEAGERQVSPNGKTKLHLSFFQPTESDESEIFVPEEDIPVRSRTSRAHSDSSYYTYQKRHRHHMMPVFPKISSGEQFQGKEDINRSCKQNFPTKIEAIKHSLTHANSNWKCLTSEKEGVDNKAFDESVLGSNSMITYGTRDTPDDSVLGSNSMLTFGTKDSPPVLKSGLKIVCVDHENEDLNVGSDDGSDSFDEVSLDNSRVLINDKVQIEKDIHPDVGVNDD